MLGFPPRCRTNLSCGIIKSLLPAIYTTTIKNSLIIIYICLYEPEL